MHRALEKLETLGRDDPGHALRNQGESPWLTSAKFKLVDACNLRCFMCDYWKGKRAGELSTDEVKTVITGLSHLGCQKIHFTGGEVFIRNDAVAIFQHATDLGIRVNLTTNGTRGSKDDYRQILKMPVRSITLSIDGPVAKVHDRFRGRKGAFKDTLKTLDRLLTHRKKKTRIRINTVIHAGNIHTVPEMIHLFEERAIDGWLLIPIDPKSEAEGVLSMDDIRVYNATIAPLLSERVQIPDFDPYVFGRDETDLEYAAKGQWARGYYKTHPCHIPSYHTLIDSRGDVYPCCMGHRNVEPLGNVRKASIEAIFQGDTYQDFRLGMHKKRLDVCHRCDDFTKDNRAINKLFKEWKSTT
jgi:radical SAM protein with 4Fe4S-binding SPASM domain